MRVHRYDACGICETNEVQPETLDGMRARGTFDGLVHAFDHCATLGADHLMDGV